jgi:small subunit ribosomal protein S16
MVSIRLSRHGTKKRPFYHIVVTDSRNRRDGRHLERIGYLDPLASEAEGGCKIDVERAKHWRDCGAKISARVAGLLKKHAPPA